MRRLLTILAIAVSVGSVSAQQLAKKPTHPDFSGTWVVDVDKSNQANGRPPGTGRAGAPVSLKQDALTIRIFNVNGDERAVYGLDGKEVTHKVPELTTGGLNPRMNSPTPGSNETYKSTWQGEKLVTTMTGRGESGPSLLTETRYLDGQWMVVTNVRKTPTGDVTTTFYYKRVPK